MRGLRVVAHARGSGPLRASISLAVALLTSTAAHAAPDDAHAVETAREAFELFRSGCYSAASDVYARLYAETQAIAVLSDLAKSLKLACRTEEARARFEELSRRCAMVRTSLEVSELKLCDDGGSHLRELRLERYRCAAPACARDVVGAAASVAAVDVSKPEETAAPADPRVADDPDQSRLGTITLSTSVEVSVEVDGKLAGVSPAIIPVRKTQGQIKLSGPRVNGTVTVTYQLADGGPAVKLEADPPAIVRHNGLSLGKTPQRVDAASRHRFSLIWRGERAPLVASFLWTSRAPSPSDVVDPGPSEAAARAGTKEAGSRVDPRNAGAEIGERSSTKGDEKAHAQELYSRAWRLWTGGDASKAIDQLRKCVALTRAPTLNVARCHRTLGTIYAGLGDTPKSLEHYRKYLALEPAAPDQTRVKEIIREAEASQ